MTFFGIFNYQSDGYTYSTEEFVGIFETNALAEDALLKRIELAEQLKREDDEKNKKLDELDIEIRKHISKQNLLLELFDRKKQIVDQWDERIKIVNGSLIDAQIENYYIKPIIMNQFDDVFIDL